MKNWRLSWMSILNAVLQIGIGFYFVRKPESPVYLSVFPILFGLVVLPIQQSLQHHVKSAVRVFVALCLISTLVYVKGYFELREVNDVRSIRFLNVLAVSSMLGFVLGLVVLVRQRIHHKKV